MFLKLGPGSLMIVEQRKMNNVRNKIRLKDFCVHSDVVSGIISLFNSLCKQFGIKDPVNCHIATYMYKHITTVNSLSLRPVAFTCL